MSHTEASISTGIETLDEIMHGGFTADRLYLIEGYPGTGKTTLAMQFLLDGAKQGHRGLYVSLSETRSELEGVAASHGWSLEGLEIHELVDQEELIHEQAQYTMFEPSEIELGATIDRVLKKIDAIRPQRIVFDSLSEMRLLAQGPLRYRRQILALKQFFVGRGCTTLMLDDKSGGDVATDTNEQLLRSIAHGVIRLEQALSEYGTVRRHLRIIKHRGRDFIGGVHDVAIKRGGMLVYPRKTHDFQQCPSSDQDISSGNDELDALIGGGLMEGTSTLLLGPAGVGKSTTATQFAVAAAERGERAVFFEFEENRANERGLKLEVKYASEIPESIESDPKRLRQILINLIGNAIKFTEQGSVEIVVCFTSAPASGTADQAIVGHLKCAICDSGIGMTAEQQACLFEPFFQGNSIITQQFGGTGLGLAISQRLAKMLNGEIQVESTLNQGSTFTLKIAVGDLNNKQLIQPVSQAVSEGKATSINDVRLDAHVLIVDDRRDIRYLSNRIVTMAGGRVTEAEDGVRAIDTFQQASSQGVVFDAILLDMQMPHMDGYETASELRKLGYTNPIIALTADAMQDAMTRCLSAGCDHHISKPINTNKLLHLLQELTSNRSLQRQL